MSDFKQKVAERVKLLPLMSHYDDSQLVTTSDPNGELPKNVVPWYFVVRLIIFGVLGFAFIKYALPIIMTIAGTTIAVIASVALVFGAITLAPLYAKYLKELSKTLRKKMIDNDPFRILFEQKGSMVKNRSTFSKENANMGQLTNKLTQLSYENEEKAKNTQVKISELKDRADNIKEKIDKGLISKGEIYKETPEYNTLSNELRKVLADSNRSASQLIQYKNFTETYGIRANLFKKVGFKMDTILTAMDIKIDDFDVTIEMLKNEYDMARNIKNATDSAGRAMGLTKSWEVDYALEVVTMTINNDIASAVGNLTELEKITKELNLDMDNEESYARLEKLAESITNGTDLVPSSSKFQNPDYKFTHEDKAKSGGFGSLMN